MKRYSAILIALFLTIAGFAQTAGKQNNDCIKRNNYSFTTRLKNYPFNLSSGIQIVSFKENETSDKDSLPRQNDTICYSRLYEVKMLTYTQVDRLTDIFYNYGYRVISHSGIRIVSIAECYNPRNAIIFLDKNGKAFEYIEICFECRRTEESSPRISIGPHCDQKMDILKDFFSKAGIEYGTK